MRVKEEELTEDLMKELIHLEVQDHEIETHEGLQYAENLETLNASNNKLQTLDPIKDLHNLVCLNVSRNQLRDLQALHGFRQLKKLNISRNISISANCGLTHTSMWKVMVNVKLSTFCG